MFKLWCLAEEDLLDSSNAYQLKDTGQGLHRVQQAPRIYKAISKVLLSTQQKVNFQVEKISKTEEKKLLVFETLRSTNFGANFKKWTKSKCLESLVTILFPEISRDVNEGHCFNTLKSHPVTKLISRSTNFVALLKTLLSTFPVSRSIKKN